MIKIHFILIILLSLLINVGYSQKSQLSTKWQSEKYNNPASLSNIDFLYDNKGKLLYLLTNDKHNLYVHVRVLDEMAQIKLIEFGFNVDIKVKGDKRKYTIEYPLPKNERMAPIIILSNNSEKNRANFNLIKKQTVQQFVQMRISGFLDKEVSIINADSNKLEMSGAMTVYDNGNLQYLLTIPLNNLNITESADNYISMVLKSGSLELANENNIQQIGTNGGTVGGQGDSGIGGRGGSAFPGGRAGTNSQDIMRQQRGSSGSMNQISAEKQELSTPIKIKLKNLLLLKELD